MTDMGEKALFLLSPFLAPVEDIKRVGNDRERNLFILQNIAQGRLWHTKGSFLFGF